MRRVASPCFPPFMVIRWHSIKSTIHYGQRWMPDEDTCRESPVQSHLQIPLLCIWETMRKIRIFYKIFIQSEVFLDG